MTESNVPTPETIAANRARTVPLQGLINRVVRGLLRAPLLSRFVGQRLLTVYAVGRRSGRCYAVPVAYSHRGGSLLVGSQFRWLRNLRSGEPVQIRLKGRRATADALVFTDEVNVVENLAFMAKDNHQFAQLNKIDLDQFGEPLPDHLHLAWAAGARVVRLTPR